jgi:hypothetical protein
MKFGSLLLSVPFAVVCAVPAEPACVEITSAGTTIAEPGCYVMAASIVMEGTEGFGIRIDADMVDLDLGGFALVNSFPGQNNATGVVVNSHYLVRVHDGSLIGWLEGIHAFDGGQQPSTSNVFEDLTVALSRRVGIWAAGTGNVIRRVVVADTGGPGNSSATGILVHGRGSRVVDSDVQGVTAHYSGSAWGIALASGTGHVVAANRVSESSTWGIWADLQVDGKLRGNTVVGCPRPYEAGGTTLTADNF